MDAWRLTDGSQQQNLEAEQHQPQYVSREQAAREFEQVQAQHRQEIQQQQQQLDLLRQQIQQQQQENQLLQQERQQQQHKSSLFEAAIALMAEGQKNLADNMNRILTRLDSGSMQTVENRQTAPRPRQDPPHLQPSQHAPHDRQNYAPSSPSEGAYAKDPLRKLVHQKEPKIRENLKFTGESRLL